jgi:ABC-2 type transport system permease protein
MTDITTEVELAAAPTRTAAQELADQRSARLATEPLLMAGPTAGLFAGTYRAIADLWSYRELLLLLVRRELKARYKDSALGFLWSLLRPLALLLVYYVAIGKFLGAERSIPEFAVYVFTGLTAWTFYNEIISGGTGSIVSNAGLIKKVYLPREVFPLAVVGSALFNLATQASILIVAVLALGSVPTGVRWLYFPLAIAVLGVWATAFALVLSAANVYLRDVQYLVEISMMTLFWASPIVYSWELVRNTVSGIWLDVYLLNPVTVAALGMQRTFWVAGTGKPLPAELGLRMGITLVVGVLFLWFAQRVFSRLESNFAQEI